MTIFKTPSRTPFRTYVAVILIALTLAASACDSNFYLSEAEAAAYANLFVNESSANGLAQSTLTGQTLRINFNSATNPPVVTSTNLLTLMRDHTTLGLIEGFNSQVHLDRLNGELQSQIERFVRTKLEFYNGANSADIKLTRLNYINMTFLNQPTFTYHPERQAISFNQNINMEISGAIQIDALDLFSNIVVGANGTHALIIQVNNLNLNGEVSFSSAFTDASQINLKITPTVGSIVVGNAPGSSAPVIVRSGMATFLQQQLSQPLTGSFLQRYEYFTLSGLSLAASTAQPPINFRHTYNPLPTAARPMMHMVARAADGKLYHMQKTEGGMNVISSVLPFPSLVTRIENEPALYASATDQLELAATTITGQLVFAHWRDETWGLQTTIAPPGAAIAFRGKPAILASAPGQVEIVVTGQNGSLWHVRRINGIWSTPTAIPIAASPGSRNPPYRDPMAVLSGNKLTVAYIEQQNHLNVSVFDLESGLWGQSGSITTAGTLHPAFAPAITSSGDGRVELVYALQNGTPFHRAILISPVRMTAAGVSQGFATFVGETSIGGTLSASPILVTSSSKQIELIVRGTDNKLYHKHFVGPDSPIGFNDGLMINPGWQSWVAMTDNYSGTLTFSTMSAFAAAAGGTGKIGVVSLTIPTIFDSNPQQYLNHNTYDTSRFSMQPWKAVTWRGFERVQGQRFIGQPALAMTDRDTSLSYIKDDFTTLQRTRLTDRNIFQLASNVASTAGVVSARAVRSMPNYTDVVIAGTDRQLRHYRCKDRSTCTTTLVPLTPFRTYRRVALVGYGNGYLDLVATTGEGHPYHWRYQNEAWSSGTDLSPATAYTGPLALTNLGAGRLGLILVNSTDFPAVSYLANGVWSTPRVFTNFPIERAFFGPQSVKSWGDGSFDYLLVARQNRALWQGRMGPREYTGNPFLSNVTPGRPAANLGGTINDLPVLTVFSPTRMQIIAEGMDANLYTNWSRPDNTVQIFIPNAAPPIFWGGFGGMGGHNLKISDVAKIGNKEMVLVAVDNGGTLLTSRFNGDRWQQFQPLLSPSVVTPTSLLQPMLTNY